MTRVEGYSYATSKGQLPEPVPMSTLFRNGRGKAEGTYLTGVRPNWGDNIVSEESTDHGLQFIQSVFFICIIREWIGIVDYSMESKS
jgi:hypothetical protein